MYLPNFVQGRPCRTEVYAEYQLREKSFWGYDVSVHNHAEDVAAPHKVHDSGKTLCAKAAAPWVVL